MFFPKKIAQFLKYQNTALNYILQILKRKPPPLAGLVVMYLSHYLLMKKSPLVHLLSFTFFLFLFFCAEKGKKVIFRSLLMASLRHYGLKWNKKLKRVLWDFKS